MIQREHQPAIAVAVLVGLLASIIWYLLVGQARGAEPVPTSDELARAEAEIREVFGEDLRDARKPADKLAIARQLIDTAAGSRSAARWALLTRARDLAAEAGDSAVAMGAVQGLVDGFTPQKQQDAASWARDGHRAWNGAAGLFGQLQAAECYLRAVGELEGFERGVIDKRLAQLQGGPAGDEELLAKFEPLPAGSRMEDGVAVFKFPGFVKEEIHPWLKSPLRGSTFVAGWEVQAKWYHAMRVRVDDDKWFYCRGHWFNEGQVVYDNSKSGKPALTQRPGPKVERPDEWHRLRVEVTAKEVRFLYDGEVQWTGPAPAGRSHTFNVSPWCFDAECRMRGFYATAN